MIKRLVFAVMTVASVVSIQDASVAGIVVTTEVVQPFGGDNTARTVTVNIKARTFGDLTTPPGPPDDIDSTFERINNYNLQFNVTGANISAVSVASASYSNALPFSDLTEVDFDLVAAGTNPNISGTQVRFQAGPSTNAINGGNIGIPRFDNILGTFTLTVTQNGSFSISVAPLSTPSTTLTGFARNGPDPDIDQVVLEGTNFTVSDIVAVPEPSSIALIGIALAGFGGLQLRRRMNAAKA